MEIPETCPKCGKPGYWDKEFETFGDGDYPDEIYVWYTCQTGNTSLYLGTKIDPVCGYETPKVVYKPVM